MKTFSIESLGHDALVDPSRDANALLNDAGILLESVVDQLNVLSHNLCRSTDKNEQYIGSSIFGTLCLGQIAAELLGKGHSKMLKGHK